MQDFIINIMNQFGYLGIALLIAIENIFPPIPSEVILTFGGFMTAKSELNIYGVVLASTIGSVAGAMVLYALGRFLNPERIERWLDGRIGRILHLKKQDVTRAEGWFVRRGKLTVFFCRFIPIVRSLISIPAGMAKMNMGIFLLLTTLGTAIWNTVLVYLGALFGASYEVVVQYFNTYTTVAVIVLAALAAAFCVFYYKRRIRSRKKKQMEYEAEDE
jgi:Uncharacterized membrane-associated protein